jgi:hypothetical protein
MTLGMRSERFNNRQEKDGIGLKPVDLSWGQPYTNW